MVDMVSVLVMADMADIMADMVVMMALDTMVVMVSMDMDGIEFKHNVKQQKNYRRHN